MIVLVKRIHNNNIMILIAIKILRNIKKNTKRTLWLLTTVECNKSNKERCVTHTWNKRLNKPKKVRTHYTTSINLNNEHRTEETGLKYTENQRKIKETGNSCALIRNHSNK